MLDSAAGSCDNLSNLVLLFMQLELFQELRKHVIDPIQGDGGFSELVLAIETVPDVAHSAVVLGNTAQGVIHKRYNGPWMHILSCLYT